MQRSIVLLFALISFLFQSSAFAQQSGNSAFVKLFDKGPWDVGSVLDLMVSSSGQVYVLTYDGQIFKLAFDNWKEVKVDNISKVRGLVWGSDDQLYLYDDKGVYKSSGDGWNLSAVDLDLPEDSRMNFVRLASGNEMVFQFSNRVKSGLISFQNNQWKRITAFEDYQFVSTISGFEFLKDGSVILGMRDAEGVYKIDDSNLKKINDKEKDPIYSVKGLKIDEKDIIYVALDYSFSSYHDPTRPQLMSFDGENWKDSGPRYNESDLPIRITTINRDSKGTIWLGTPNGLYSSYGDNWNKYPLDSQNAPGHVQVCVIDRSDNVWCICEAGLLMIAP